MTSQPPPPAVPFPSSVVPVSSYSSLFSFARRWTTTCAPPGVRLPSASTSTSSTKLRTQGNRCVCVVTVAAAVAVVVVSAAAVAVVSTNRHVLL